MSRDKWCDDWMVESVPNTDKPGSLALPAGSPAGPRKGEKHGECNRTACHRLRATWWNRSTERYYCKPCAMRIMSYPENAGLLTQTEPQENIRSQTHPAEPYKLYEHPSR